jgi:hypothetical protein
MRDSHTAACHEMDIDSLYAHFIGDDRVDEN